MKVENHAIVSTRGEQGDGWLLNITFDINGVEGVPTEQQSAFRTLSWARKALAQEVGKDRIRMKQRNPNVYEYEWSRPVNPGAVARGMVGGV
jgi:hypothetical protein